MKRTVILHRQDEDQDYARGEWFLQTVPGNTVTVRYEEKLHFPNLKPENWILFFPKPPTIAGQQATRATVALIGKEREIGYRVVRELGGIGRTFFRMDFPATQSNDPQGYQAQTIYEAQLSRRLLVPGPATQAPRPLSALERKYFTARTPVFDWKGPEVTRWLAKGNLRPARGEGNVAFAWRVARHVAGTLKRDRALVSKNSHCAEVVCKAGAGNAVGLNIAAVAALRANDIPARLRVGVFVNQAGTSEKVPYGNRAEFYDATAGGWIPMDPSSIAELKGQGWKAFGRDLGNILTFHVDCDITLEAGKTNPIHKDFIDFSYFWVTGPGSTTPRESEESFTVTLDDNDNG